MKKTILTLLLIVTCTLAVSAKKPIAVYITAGQSNTDGRILNDQLPEYIKQNGYKHAYWCYNSGRYSMQGKFESFWPRINNQKKPGRWTYDAIVYYFLDKSLKQDFYVIKESLGGTAIDLRCKSSNKMFWSAKPEYLDTIAAADQPGGKSLLKALCDNIDRAIDSTIATKGEYEIKAMLWHQGESDRQASSRYYDNLKAVIAYVRQHLVEKTGNKKYASLPVILGGIAHHSRGWSEGVENAQIRIAQEDANVHFVPVPDATLQSDIMHFDAQGGELLGKKMYNKLVELKLAGKKAAAL